MNKSLDDAVREMLGAPAGALVSVEITGGGSVQIGDETWDTEPTQIECRAFVVGAGGRWEATFPDLPSLWEALTQPHNVDCDICHPNLHAGCQDRKTGRHYKCSKHRNQ